MRVLISLFILVVSLSVAGDCSAEGSDQTNARIQRLENDVSALKKENELLSQQLSKLHAIVNEKLFPQSAEADAALSTCSRQLDKLKEQRESLKKLGLQDRHPDVSRLTAQIQGLTASCESEKSR